MTNVEMARTISTLLKNSGLTIEDLLRVENQDLRAANTKNASEYVAQILAGLTRNTARSYRTHFNYLVNGLERQCECTCDTCVDQFRYQGFCECKCGTCKSALAFEGIGDFIPSEQVVNSLNLRLLVQSVRRMAEKRALADNRARAKKGLSPKPTYGQGAQEMCVTSLSCFFAQLVDDGLLAKNPADKLPRGNRSASKRRSLKDDELIQLFDTVVSGGDDPDLDFALTWAEFELGARRTGIVTLTMGQLDFEAQTVMLHEKGNRQDHQPCSFELLTFLEQQAILRGGSRCDRTSPDYNPGAKVFYYKDSTASAPHPITSRRFDTLHQRIQLSLPWANSISYSGHALRHTIGTMVERLAGCETAKMMLRHAGTTQTDTYVKAGPVDVATAISAITGRPHPLSKTNDGKVTSIRSSRRDK